MLFSSKDKDWPPQKITVEIIYSRILHAVNSDSIVWRLELIFRFQSQWERERAVLGFSRSSLPASSRTELDFISIQFKIWISIFDTFYFQNFLFLAKKFPVSSRRQATRNLRIKFHNLFCQRWQQRRNKKKSNTEKNCHTSTSPKKLSVLNQLSLHIKRRRSTL